ncbi:MAG: ParB/RepB/Spo0J family partition protein [Rhodobacteraceae bacterium]|nr:ParB/RepB/Spo0J family partition protein [Paracoccaceae bacterium]
MADKRSKPRGLGRGLSALMADVAPPATPGGAGQGDIRVPIERLIANPNQPRRNFDQNELENLAASIREKGILQPLIVRSVDGEKYEIIAGERRWRAAQMAQIHQIPVLVRDFDDAEVLEVAIIENIQRADLNAMEEAAGFRQLMDSFGHTQEKLATALGKSRSHIANLLRLLTLPVDVQDLLRDGRLAAGHARALITAENPSELAKLVVKNGLSVRATERLAKSVQPDTGKKEKPGRKSKVNTKDADTRALEGDLAAILRMAVSIEHEPGGEAGRMVIKYSSLDQLDELCNKLSR